MHVKKETNTNVSCPRTMLSARQVVGPVSYLDGLEPAPQLTPV